MPEKAVEMTTCHLLRLDAFLINVLFLIAYYLLCYLTNVG